MLPLAGEQPRDSTVAGVALQRQHAGGPAGRSTLPRAGSISILGGDAQHFRLPHAPRIESLGGGCV